MKRVGSRWTSQSGVTLLELVIVVGMIGILAVVAIPLYQKFVMEARISTATRALYHSYQAMQNYRYRNPNFEYTDVLESESGPSLELGRVFSQPNFNIVTGSPGGGGGVPDGGGGAPPPGGDPIPAKALSQLPGNEYLKPSDSQYSLNAFGFSVQGAQVDRSRMLIGVELDPDRDGFHHVLAINESGQFFEICNDIADSTSAGATTFLDYTNVGASCLVAGGGETGGGDSGELD